jgi:predicted amidohydrolase
MRIKIAFVQLLPGIDLDENLDIGKKACVEAKEKGADIALFPEMWSDGYYLPQDEKEVNSLAISKDSDFINEFRGLARELQMAIGITFLEKNNPRPFNSVIFFDRHGNKILHYSKLHTCAFDDEKVLSEGTDFYVADLDLNEGTVKIGSMICFDREFPESARILMLKGAELILAPNACPMEINRLSALRTRAYENMVASGELGLYVAELDLDRLRTHRSNDIMGDKYRHPEKYGILSNPDVRDVIGGEFVHW